MMFCAHEIRQDAQYGPVPSVSYVFRYNRTFGERPSLQSDRAWRNLFPEQNGFFKHPTIAPERSAFSVFHQLHCLVNTK